MADGGHNPCQLQHSTTASFEKWISRSGGQSVHPFISSNLRVGSISEGWRLPAPHLDGQEAEFAARIWSKEEISFGQSDSVSSLDAGPQLSKCTLHSDLQFNFTSSLCYIEQQVGNLLRRTPCSWSQLCHGLLQLSLRYAEMQDWDWKPWVTWCPSTCVPLSDILLPPLLVTLPWFSVKSPITWMCSSWSGATFPWRRI